MLKPWVRWGSAAIPVATSVGVTHFLISTGNWRQWGVEELPPMTPSQTSFGDLANITFTADCISRGQPIEPCDPYGRRFQPYVVLPARAFALLGLGADSTGAIGVALSLVTIALVATLALVLAAQWRRGPGPYVGVQVVLALGAVSPGVLLGIERGQIESVTALLVVVSLIAFAQSTRIRWLAVLTSVLATMLKYLTVGMFLAFANRETLVRRNWAVAMGVAVSGVFLVFSIPQLQQAANTSGSRTPQTTMSAFGLTNTIATPLSGSELQAFPPEAVADAWPTLQLIGILLFLTTIAVGYLLVRRLPLPPANSSAWVLTLGSGGVLLLPYMLGSSHDYRLVFLLPFIVGVALWWGGTPNLKPTLLPPTLIALALVALVTSASMTPTPQGWRWPSWVIVLGDTGLFLLLAFVASLSISMITRGRRMSIPTQAS